MNPSALDVDTLRRLAIEQPEALSTRLVALIVALGFLVAVLNLVRRGRLQEEYTPIWTVVGPSAVQSTRGSPGRAPAMAPKGNRVPSTMAKVAARKASERGIDQSSARERFTIALYGEAAALGSATIRLFGRLGAD